MIRLRLGINGALVNAKLHLRVPYAIELEHETATAWKQATYQVTNIA